MNQFFSAGIIAAVIGLWGQIKSVFMNFYSLFMESHHIEAFGRSTFLFHALDAILEEGFKPSFTASKVYMSSQTLRTSDKHRIYVTWEALRLSSDKHMFFRKGWRCIWVKFDDECVEIRNIRKTFDVIPILKRIETSNNNTILKDAKPRAFFRRVSGTLAGGTGGGGIVSGGRVRGVVATSGAPPAPEEKGGSSEDKNDCRIAYLRKKNVAPMFVSLEEITPESDTSGISTVSLGPDALSVVADIDRWVKSEKWYLEKNIPWKKGLLLYGPPGTGKTSLVRAIAHQYGFTVTSMDLGSMNNNDFKISWDGALESAGGGVAVVLLEDFDNVFKGRVNQINPKNGLTFDYLLNTIDGVDNSDGVLLIITTNDIDSIDPAIGVPMDSGISTRPGRIDSSIYMGPLNREGRVRIANRILGDTPEHMDRMVKDGDGDTGAVFQERCRIFALKQYWSRKDNP